MNFHLQYLKTTIPISVPDACSIHVISPKITEPPSSHAFLLQQALDYPVNFSFPLFPVHSVAIAVNDKTRPVPHDAILPPLLQWLANHGIQKEQITFLIATGTHTPIPESDYKYCLPETICREYRILSHDTDASDLVYLGNTQIGTPVWVNAEFHKVDFRIVVGNIEPHHFMGFSGGMKTAAIGLAGRETINGNHSLLLHPNSRTGLFEDNPMRMDVEEIGRLMDVHLALNVVMNVHKQIVSGYAGNPLDVMKKAIPQVNDLNRVPVPHLCDLVIASAGGYPKDINFYQSQKALTHAAMLTRDGGTVILLAACPEGIGSSSYEEFIKGMQSHEEAYERFKRQGFQVGPHKAFLVARDARRVNILLKSEIHPRDVKRLLLTPVDDPQTAIDAALKFLPDHPHIGIMPIATITIPEIP